ncbi:amidohydrolase [Chloroflexi bacterium TSY]|nr:amidohydrolase [Chloroflexi bacterium TSY]
MQVDFKGEPGNSLRNMIAHIAWLGASYDKPPRAKLATKQDLLTRMGKGIIDYSILFPSELLPIGYLPEPKWAAALATAYNEYMVDAYQNLPGVKIAVVVAPQHPEHAAAEIDRHASHPDVVSVCIPDVGVNPPIGNQKYRPIFEAAARNSLPISFHGIEALIHDNYPLRVAHFPTLMQVNSMGFPFTSMLQIMSVVCEGIPVRFPNLKFAVLEAGLTWMPFIMYRLDAAYLRYRTELPTLEKKPSDYIREWYIGSHELEALPGRGDLVKLIELYQGQTRTMWASDWPHLERDLVAGFMRYDMDEDLRRKILGENAIEFFGIEPRSHA